MVVWHLRYNLADLEHITQKLDKKERRLKQVRRAQWLRAALLGANDGLLSTTALMLGVGAAKEDQRSMILSGLAGAVAGACSMAVGEFVSVSTQRDIEEATVSCPASKDELEDSKGKIKVEITDGVETKVAMSPALTPPGSFLRKKLMDAEQSADKESPAVTPEKLVLERKSPIVLSSVNSPMMKVIVADAKMAEEEREREVLPNPYRAAVVSALAFLAGSVVPLLPALFLVHNLTRVVAIVVVTSIALGLFGGLGAYLGGSPVSASAIRVLLGGWVSMAITYGLLKLLDREKNGHDDDD